MLLNFDVTTDRLFSVGDLIDRGPNSLDCANLIYNPYFFSIRGNHEQLMIDTMLHNNENMAMVWISNGGIWRFSCDDNELRVCAKDLQDLPLIISVGEGKDRFNIVHAELTHHQIVNGHPEIVRVTDQMIDNWTFNEHDEQDMIWGRTMITRVNALNFNKTIRFHDETLSPTFVGHTQVRQSVMVEKQIYIDTSAVNHHISTNKSEENCLTIAEPNKRILHKFSMIHQTVESIKFNAMPKY